MKDGGLECNSKVRMKLYFDSTNAQAFYERLGPGRAKLLATRVLWGQMSKLGMTLVGDPTQSSRLEHQTIVS